MKSSSLTPHPSSFPRIFRGLKWSAFLFLLTAPLMWVHIHFNPSSRQFLAEWNLGRVQWWLKVFPVELARSWYLLIPGIAAVMAWRWGWFPSTESIGRSCKTMVPDAVRNALTGPWGLFLFPLVTILVCSQLTDQQRGWGIFAAMYVLLASGLNLTVGMTGLLVIGYSAFFAVGAYTYAILNQWFLLPFWAAFIPAAAVAASVGLFLGLPSIRLKGDYLAIVSLGFGEVLRILLKNWKETTGGDDGIFIRREAMFPKLESLPLFPHGVSREASGFCVMILLAALGIWLIRNLVHSRIGRAWIAIREDETAAAAMGIPTFQLKLLAFSMSAAWAGVAGVCFAAYQGHIVPDSFNFTESIFILSMVILGGMGTVSGPVFGAVIFYLGYELLRSKLPGLADYRLMIFGAIMVMLMILRPQGLLGSRQRKIEITGT